MAGGNKRERCYKPITIESAWDDLLQDARNIQLYGLHTSHRKSLRGAQKVVKGLSTGAEARDYKHFLNIIHRDCGIEVMFVVSSSVGIVRFSRFSAKVRKAFLDRLRSEGKVAISRCGNFEENTKEWFPETEVLHYHHVDESPQTQTHTIFENAFTQGFEFVFGNSICYTIYKQMAQAARYTVLTGAIKMSFPIRGSTDCSLCLVIPASWVAAVAKALFDVDVESDGETRTTLIPPVFGENIASAMLASSKREEEVEKSIEKTDCVSMTWTSDPDEDGIINIILGLERSVELCNILY
ncbi:hypothetical protein, variant [Verruconis gallopava]|uniref:Uncharacterized protein n=1 Tax=Verruconis gallopava TaxID=253628 RepID=A0A0D1YDF5_9PEZI|nr:hypothetical protein, variant [Verruconis gallopava]KIV98771.1 hypothetical protein, variant [Verruconis gallopava]